VGARFFEGLLRKMRKYERSDVDDQPALHRLRELKSGEAIIGPTRQDSASSCATRGHDSVIDYFRLRRRRSRISHALDATGSLLDLFLMYGQMQTTVRLAPHPLASGFSRPIPKTDGASTARRREESVTGSPLHSGGTCSPLAARRTARREMTP